jgi:hypothetical protein
MEAISFEQTSVPVEQDTVSYEEVIAIMDPFDESVFYRLIQIKTTQTIQPFWYKNIEDSVDAKDGDSFLARRDICCSAHITSTDNCERCNGPKIVFEYGLRRTKKGWRRQLVIYPFGEMSPCPFKNDKTCPEHMLNYIY